METTMLGTSGISVSRIAFGGCPMGGHGWGEVSRENLVRAVREAVDSGVNFFDTADTYGLGESEEILGTALKGRRDDAVIATKFGVRHEGGKPVHDNSPGWIRAALDASLKRLGTDHVDLYQIHYRDEETPLQAVVETLLDLQTQGKIRHLGLSNISLAETEELKLHSSKFVSFQNEFSLATRELEPDISAITEQHRLTPLTWGSLGQGILSGKYSIDSEFGPNDRRSRAVYVNFRGERLARNMEIVEVLREVSASVGKSVPAVAIRWILDHLPGSVAIVGVKNSEQLASNAESLGWSLPTEAKEALDAVSAVPFEEPNGQS